MSETVRTYLLDEPDAVVPMDRNEFYDVQIARSEAGDALDRAVEVVAVIMVNTAGQLILQKRSFDKRHNPGLIDKAIGGHVQYDDTINHTVMVETVQELQTPSIVLNDQKDFTKTMNVLEEYLETIAVIKHIDTSIQTFKKVIDGKSITIANKINLFFGVYDGRVRPADQEALGVLFYTLADLDLEMEKMPDLFSNDIHAMLKAWRPQLEEFMNEVGSKA